MNSSGHYHFLGHHTRIMARHYSDVTMNTMASQIIDNLTVCSTVCLGQHQRKHQSLCYWPLVRGIHRWFASQRASNTQSVPMAWRHHGVTGLDRGVCPAVHPVYWSICTFSAHQVYTYCGLFFLIQNSVVFKTNVCHFQGFTPRIWAKSNEIYRQFRLYSVASALYGQVLRIFSRKHHKTLQPESDTLCPTLKPLVRKFHIVSFGLFSAKARWRGR